MKHVQLIRQRIVRGQLLEMRRLRQFISMTGDNNDVLERMDGEGGEQLVAELTEFIMARLGHINTVPATERGSRARRAVSSD